MPTTKRPNSRFISKKALVLVVMGLSAAMVDAHAINVRASRSCGSWLSEKAQGRTTDSNFNETWLLGFLSGLAIQSDKDALKGTDNPSIFLWVDNYCRTNPLKDTIDAGMDLFDELVKQKKLP